MKTSVYITISTQNSLPQLNPRCFPLFYTLELPRNATPTRSVEGTVVLPRAGHPFGKSYHWRQHLILAAGAAVTFMVTVGIGARTWSFIMCLSGGCPKQQICIILLKWTFIYFYTTFRALSCFLEIISETILGFLRLPFGEITKIL